MGVGGGRRGDGPVQMQTITSVGISPQNGSEGGQAHARHPYFGVHQGLSTVPFVVSVGVGGWVWGYGMDTAEGSGFSHCISRGTQGDRMGQHTCLPRAGGGGGSLYVTSLSAWPAFIPHPLPPVGQPPPPLR